jgi:hypothetical protein
MFVRERFEAAVAQALILLVLLVASFAGYCINQAVGAAMVPLTVVPIFVISAFFRNISIVSLSVVGLIDDCFANSYIGFFALCYLFLSAIIMTHKKYLEDKKITLILFLLFVFSINFIYRK